MRGNRKGPPMTFLLSNLTQTHALPLLPLPEIPLDSEAQNPKVASEQLDAYSRDEDVVSQLQGLLQSTDISSMYVPGLSCIVPQMDYEVLLIDKNTACAENFGAIFPMLRAGK